MKRQKAHRTNVQLIVGALLTGKTLTSRDIADMILESEGRDIKIQNIATMLAKISSSDKCDLGFFVKKEKKGNAFTYQMVEEALDLPEKKAYELTLKIGKGRYTLDDALEEVPGLARYVKGRAVKSLPKARRQVAKKVSEPKPVEETAPEPEEVPDRSGSESAENILGRAILKALGLEKSVLNVKVSVKFEE